MSRNTFKRNLGVLQLMSDHKLQYNPASIVNTLERTFFPVKRSRAMPKSYTTRRARRAEARGAVRQYMKENVGRELVVRGGRRGYYRTGGYFGYGQEKRTYAAKEFKFLDSSSDNGSPSATGETSASLVLIPQGVTESTRVGRVAYIKQLKANITWQLNDNLGASAASEGAQQIRFCLVCDKQANGQLPGWLDVFETTLTDSFRNLSNESRFDILHDDLFIMNANGGVEVGLGGRLKKSRQIRFTKTWPKGGLPIEYSSTTGAQTEIRSNNLFWVYNVSNTANTQLFICNRIRFTD